ncbi:MAG: hypothetical protein IT330_15830 [Anaerolineae bacterium]|nr:hypothetical protein [Anaerolineae bacterium]
MSGDQSVIPGNERGLSVFRLVGLGIFIALFIVFALSTSGESTSAATSDALAMYQNPTPTPTPAPMQGDFLVVGAPNPRYIDRIGVRGYAKPRYVGVTNGSVKVESVWIADFYLQNHVEVGWWRQASTNIPNCGFGNIPYLFAAWRINNDFYQYPEPCDVPPDPVALATPIDVYNEFRVERGTDGLWHYYFRGIQLHQLSHPNLTEGKIGGQGERHHHFDQCMTRWQLLGELAPNRVWSDWPDNWPASDIDPDCKYCEDAPNMFTVRWNSASCY